MEPESQHTTHIEYVPLKYTYGGVIASALFFQFLNQVVGRVGPPKSVDVKDAWKWRNLCVSWVHAVIVGWWDISCFILHPEILDDLVDGYNVYCYAMVVFSLGYFCHDFIEITRSGKFFTMWEVILHHIAVNGMFFYNLVTNRCIAYTVVALMAEINSMFLHLRKLLQMLKVGFDNLLYRVNVYANLATFLVGRFFSLAWIVYGIMVHGHRVPRVYINILSVATFAMCLINIGLFTRLVKSDILRRPSTGDSSGSKRRHGGVTSHANGAVTSSSLNGDVTTAADSNGSATFDANWNHSKVESIHPVSNGTRAKQH